MPKLTAPGHLGLAWETTYGTPVVPAVYVPYNSLKFSDDYKKIIDEGRRGGIVKDWAVYNGPRSGSVEMEGDVYPETMGYFFKGILGGYSVTGASAPYTHTFTAAPTLPSSMTLQEFYGITERQFSGAVLSELDVKFDVENVVTFTAKWLTKASTVVTTTTPSYASQTNPFMGYTLTFKIGGSSNVNLVSGEFSIKRPVNLLWTANNTQDPSRFSAGRIEITGKFLVDAEDETELLNYLNGTQTSLDFLFTRDANTSLDVQFNKVDFTKITPDIGQEYVRMDCEFRALYNTVDNGNTTIKLKNSVSTY
jgi:hypothetical protein